MRMRYILCLFLFLISLSWYIKVEGYTCQSLTVTITPEAAVAFGDADGNNISSIILATPTELDIANNTGTAYTSPTIVILSTAYNGSPSTGTNTVTITGTHYISGPYNTYFQMLSGLNTLPFYISQDKNATLGAGPITVVNNTDCIALTGNANDAGTTNCVEWTFIIPPGGLSDAIAGTYSILLLATAIAT